MCSLRPSWRCLGFDTAVEGGGDAGILVDVVECVHLSHLCFFAVVLSWLYARSYPVLSSVLMLLGEELSTQLVRSCRSRFISSHRVCTGPTCIPGYSIDSSRSQAYVDDPEIFDRTHLNRSAIIPRKTERNTSRPCCTAIDLDRMLDYRPEVKQIILGVRLVKKCL